MRSSTLITTILVVLIIVITASLPAWINLGPDNAIGDLKDNGSSEVAEEVGLVANSDPSSEEGTVYGKVTSRGEPVFATISMIKIGVNEGDSPIMTNSTAEDGRYRIEGIEVGEYSISVNSGKGVGSRDINVTSGDNEVNGELTKRITLNGVVMTSSGKEPLAGVTVSLNSETDDFSHIAPSITSSDGIYVMHDVPAGKYIISFSKSGYETKEFPIEVGSGYAPSTTVMERAHLPISEGFIKDYDLPHSFMIVGLGLALATLVFALFIRYRVKNKPGLLNKDDSKT
ncbi:MAG: hypothetical protein GX369_07440 [Euryarchaeota archaeon]|nr:hypothetical protein [Euryarchaeota archaeon]